MPNLTLNKKGINAEVRRPAGSSPAHCYAFKIADMKTVTDGKNNQRNRFLYSIPRKRVQGQWKTDL